MHSILIIDDEENIRTMLLDILSDEGYKCFSASDWKEANQLLLSEQIDIVLLDVCLPNVGGMDILDKLVKDFISLETIMISGHANIDLAVKAIKKGAFDFIEKPLSLTKILTVVENALKVKLLKEENSNLKVKLNNNIKLLGESKGIKEIKKKIEFAAQTNSRVLITGENGTGKEVVARSIHMESERNKNKFVDVNCAAIPENLIESELFGHEKGAFTGAIAQKIGKFELAHGGTLMLDEVADMTLSTQAKVLRVLQEMEFERVGGIKSIKVDVRVISATNKNIAQEIDEGNFREDLFYRLNVIPIHIPPLRERKEDIVLLINYYLEKLAKEFDRPIKKLNKDAMNLLTDYNWPGNVRELKNVVERMNILIDSEKVTANQIKNNILDNNIKSKNLDYSEYHNLKEAKDAFEKKYILEKLSENENNISKTAKELGIERSHLHKKIKKFNL